VLDKKEQLISRDHVDRRKVIHEKRRTLYEQSAESASIIGRGNQDQINLSCTVVKKEERFRKGAPYAHPPYWGELFQCGGGEKTKMRGHF